MYEESYIYRGESKMKPIKSLIEFIRRDTSDENEGAYFLLVLRWSFLLMMLYYLLYIGICVVFGMSANMVLAVPWFLMMTVGFGLTYYYSDKIMFLIYIIFIVGWTILSIYSYGWNTGGQQFLLPLLVMVFFCVHYTVHKKMLIMCALLILRLGLFFYCQEHTAQYVVGYVPSVVLQVLNSVTLFMGMTITGIIFSSNIQGAELKLMHANEKLKLQAGTDPLTGLPNRRQMTATIEEWRETNPRNNFSFAMADIDFFKRVNDTWGHDCGDVVLKTLANLFKEKMKGKGFICRWGGEEFFFFFPDMNLDEAKFEIGEIAVDVRGLKIPYGEETIRITMTFGVEENDFHSDLQALVCQADEKLYYGKEHGRNQVVG